MSMANLFKVANTNMDHLPEIDRHVRFESAVLDFAERYVNNKCPRIEWYDDVNDYSYTEPDGLMKDHLLNSHTLGLQFIRILNKNKNMTEQVVENKPEVDTGSRDYYKDIIPGYEYFQLMESFLGHEGFVGHCRGQIFKYSLRFGKKDDIKLEQTKVAWYSAYLKDYLERHARGETPYRPK